jgi:glutathione S-transferase
VATPPPTTSTPPPWPAAGAPRRPRRWPTVAWLVAITLVAGVALVGWLRPLENHKSRPASPAYTDQQVANAKANVCSAFGQVNRALGVAESLSGSNDPTAILAVATSSRQVLDFGSRYLLTKLAGEPATSSDLATAVRKQSDAYQELLIGYLDGLHYGDQDLQPAASASADATDTIQRLCK